MKVGSKILLPYLALLLLLGGAGGYVLLRFGALQDRMTVSTLREEHISSRVNELNLLERNIENNLLSYQINRNAEHLRAIEAADRNARETVSEIKSMTVTDKGHTLLQSYEKSRADMRAIREELIRAIQTNDNAVLKTAFQKWSYQSENTHALLLDLIIYKRRLLEQAIEDARQANERMHQLILGLLVLSFSMMFIASTYHNVSIVRPLKNLKKRSEGIARGDLTTPVPISNRNDEIGQLADSFQDMMRKLRIAQDILEQRVQERTKELQQAKDRIEQEVSNVRRFQQAVESTFDAVFMTTENPGIVYVNPAWERLMGFSKEESIGQDPWAFVSGDTDARIREQLLNSMRSGQAFYTEEIRARRKNGVEFDMELTVYPIRDKDGSTFLVGIAHDISRRKRLDRAKTDFVSLASHQLRTPLTGIRWALGRLHKIRETLTDSQQQMLVAARSATARMAETIDTMLTISRIEAERIELKPWDLRMKIFLTNILHECEHLYARKKQYVKLVCDEEVHLRTDPNVLHEIITNLLTNAIKYTPERGRLFVRALPGGAGKIRIEIEDTGYGIPIDQQEKVFSKFFRGDNIVQNDPDGTGLGLYLVYALTRLIGGSISFVSEENRGTTFTIVLPITPPPYGQNGVGG